MYFASQNLCIFDGKTSAVCQAVEAGASAAERCKGSSRTAPAMSDITGRIEAFLRWNVGTRKK